MKKSHLKHIIKEIIKEEIDGPGIFVPRGIEGRKEKKTMMDYKKIQDYIKNGSKGDLDLENSQITKLPDNLQVGGYLDLEKSQITELPNNLTVGRYLDLDNTQITELPDNLKVGGSLNLRNTPITTLPDNLSVGLSLNLDNSPITSLPDNLTVFGSLWLSNTPLSKKYSREEIKDIIERQGGNVTKNIYI